MCRVLHAPAQLLELTTPGGRELLVLERRAQKHRHELVLGRRDEEGGLVLSSSEAGLHQAGEHPSRALAGQVGRHLELPPDVPLTIVGEERASPGAGGERHEPQQREHSGEPAEIRRVDQHVDARAPRHDDEHLRIAQDAVADALLAQGEEDAVQERPRRRLVVARDDRALGVADRVAEPGDVDLVGEADQRDLVRRKLHSPSRRWGRSPFHARREARSGPDPAVRGDDTR
jgi:hypothetical protein